MSALSIAAELRGWKHTFWSMVGLVEHGLDADSIRTATDPEGVQMRSRNARFTSSLPTFALLCVIASAVEAQVQATPHLPGLVSETKLRGDGTLARPQILTIPSAKSIWIGGNSEKGRAHRPWLKHLDAAGNVLVEANLIPLFDAKELVQSTLRFKSALALDDGAVLIAAELRPAQPAVFIVGSNGKIEYRRTLFEGGEANVSSMRRSQDGAILVMGERKVAAAPQAAMMELDSRGNVLRERLWSKGSASGLRDISFPKTGRPVLVGYTLGDVDKTPSVWLAATGKDYEVQEEFTFVGSPYEAVSGPAGRFAVCFSESSVRNYTVVVAEFDDNLKLLWRTTVFSTTLPSCRIERVPGGGYIAAGQLIEPGPTIAVTRLRADGSIAWTYVDPIQEHTFYTSHHVFIDLEVVGNDGFILTESFEPPDGTPSSRAGLMQFRLAE
jgi:hypothetical protein